MTSAELPGTAGFARAADAGCRSDKLVADRIGRFDELVADRLAAGQDFADSGDERLEIAWEPRQIERHEHWEEILPAIQARLLHCMEAGDCGVHLHSPELVLLADALLTRGLVLGLTMEATACHGMALVLFDSGSRENFRFGWKLAMYEMGADKRH